MINFEKIKKECPKSWELLKGWVTKLLIEFKNKMGEGLEEMVDSLPEVSDLMVESMSKAYVRNLYDFFDSNKVYVVVDMTPDQWCFSFPFGELQGEYKNRIECEIAAFEAAFIILEGKI